MVKVASELRAAVHSLKTTRKSPDVFFQYGGLEALTDVLRMDGYIVTLKETSVTPTGQSDARALPPLHEALLIESIVEESELPSPADSPSPAAAQSIDGTLGDSGSISRSSVGWMTASMASRAGMSVIEEILETLFSFTNSSHKAEAHFERYMFSFFCRFPFSISSSYSV